MPHSGKTLLRSHLSDNAQDRDCRGQKPASALRTYSSAQCPCFELHFDCLPEQA